MNIEGQEYKKAVFQHYYCYYNKKVRYWTGVFNGGEIPVDAFVKSVCRTIMIQPGQARENHLDECDLYLIGDFNDETGEFQVLDKPQLLLNCGDYFGGQKDV